MHACPCWQRTGSQSCAVRLSISPWGRGGCLELSACSPKQVESGDCPPLRTGPTGFTERRLRTHFRITHGKCRFSRKEFRLISDGFWQRRSHGDPSALSKKLRIGRLSYSIVGIMRASFQIPNTLLETIRYRSVYTALTGDAMEPVSHPAVSRRSHSCAQRHFERHIQSLAQRLQACR